MRAYGGVAAEALRVAEPLQITACLECLVDFAPEDTGKCNPMEAMEACRPDARGTDLALLARGDTGSS